MLEVDDLPLAAPGELLDHVERQVVLQQCRQQPQIRTWSARKPRRSRAGVQRSDRAARRLRECGPCQRGSKRRAIKPNMPQSSLDIASSDRNGAAPGIASDLAAAGRAIGVKVDCSNSLSLRVHTGLLADPPWMKPA